MTIVLILNEVNVTFQTDFFIKKYFVNQSSVVVKYYVIVHGILKCQLYVVGNVSII